MKRRLAWTFAIISGVVLLIPDPVPLIDEATALLVFVKSMAFLGYDVKRWIPFLGKGRGMKVPETKGASAQTIDV
jgi:hypothetical protein